MPCLKASHAGASHTSSQPLAFLRTLQKFRPGHHLGQRAPGSTSSKPVFASHRLLGNTFHINFPSLALGHGLQENLQPSLWLVLSPEV